MMETSILTQVHNIKGMTVSLMTYQKDRMSLQERAVIDKIYQLMDSIICERIHHKRYTMEEYVDSVIMESVMILKRTKNSSVKKLVSVLEKGIKW